MTPPVLQQLVLTSKVLKVILGPLKMKGWASIALRGARTILPCSRRAVGSRSRPPFTAAVSSRRLSNAADGSNTHPPFYKVEGASPTGSSGQFVIGEVTDHAIDLQQARPGEVINVPYELTVSPAIRDFWQAAFYSHDRLNTSTPFARKLGFQDQVLPFSLMLFLTGSMSHADAATVQVGFESAIYHWPGFAGDTFTKRFVIKSVRSASNNKFSIFSFFCELRNQRGQIVFTVEKSMIFPFILPPSSVSFPIEPPARTLEDHLLSRVESLYELGSQSLQALRPGQLLLHSLARPLSAAQSMQLSSLARLTHERHFNTRRYKRDEMYIPGGLVLGLTLSSSARDLHEVLHEELIECSFINHVHPWDIVSSFTYINEMDENITGDLEALTIRTIGLKNMEVHRDLVDKPIPIDLLVRKGLRTKQVEQICKTMIPELSKKVVAIVDRRVLRQSPKTEAFLL